MRNLPDPLVARLDDEGSEGVYRARRKSACLLAQAPFCWGVILPWLALTRGIVVLGIDCCGLASDSAMQSSGKRTSGLIIIVELGLRISI